LSVQVVDDHVAQRADRVVEVAAVLDPEVLRHRDLHGLDVVPVPDRLEHRVGEPQVEDLLEPHLPEEVVDPVDLRLVEVLVQLAGELAGGCEVVAERLLDDDACVLGEARLREALDHGAEQERRDLEVEDRALGAVDRLGHGLVGCRVGEVAGEVGEPVGQALEDLLVELFAGTHDRVAGTLLQLVERPVVDRDPEDRAVEQAALLEPVERAEGHHLGEVAGDPERDEDVGRPRPVACLALVGLRGRLGGRHGALLSSVRSRP
jgi:hypothetical protein